MGNGGIDDGTENIKVRDYTLTMMKNNEISASYINKIYSIKYFYKIKERQKNFPTKINVWKRNNKK